MHQNDWMVIGAYCVIAIGIGVYFSKRASKNIGEFFVAGRNLPWWIAGTSIVATTFAADTPLAVSGMTRTDGIAGNWFWWSFLMGNMLATFFYARLWRRASIITDAELIELRYTGKPAAALRGSLAFYRSMLLNCITIGWVMQAMIKISGELVDWTKGQLIVVCLGLVLAYSVLSGFWGVVMTDLVQFAIAMVGSIALAVISVVKLGGIAGLKERLVETPGFTDHTLSFVPHFGAGEMALWIFLFYIGIQWWASPNAEGGGYVAQRLFATKDERHSLLASLWFTFAHYALRPWPWIIVGLASCVVFVDLPDPESAYPKMIMTFLPVGLRGLMLASLFAAFMSTMDTHLNWGASYLINDFYKRFVMKDGSERHYVFASRIGMVLIAVVGGTVAYFTESIYGAWRFMFTLTCGIGPVVLLRWYWWRINAWSEISALVTSTIVTAVIYTCVALEICPQIVKDFLAPYQTKFLLTLCISTVVWVTVTFLTPPVPKEHLKEFYRRVRPAAAFWRPIVKELPETCIERRGWKDIGAWFCGVVSVYCALFGIGKLCLAEFKLGFAFLVGSSIAAAALLHVLARPEPKSTSSAAD